MREPEGTGGVHLEFPIQAYFEVRQLSSQVRRKWDEANLIYHAQANCMPPASEPSPHEADKTLVLSPTPRLAYCAFRGTHQGSAHHEAQAERNA